MFGQTHWTPLQKKYAVYPIIYKVLYIPGGDRRIFEPSTEPHFFPCSPTQSSMGWHRSWLLCKAPGAAAEWGLTTGCAVSGAVGFGGHAARYRAMPWIFRNKMMGDFVLRVFFWDVIAFLKRLKLGFLDHSYWPCWSLPNACIDHWKWDLLGSLESATCSCRRIWGCSLCLPVLGIYPPPSNSGIYNEILLIVEFSHVRNGNEWIKNGMKWIVWNFSWGFPVLFHFKLSNPINIAFAQWVLESY